MRFRPLSGRGISIAFAVMGIVAGCRTEQRQDVELISAKGFAPSIAISPSGKVAIAWMYLDGSFASARVSLLDGAGWSELGGDLSRTIGVGAAREVLFQPDETLLMRSEGNGSVVHVWSWNGTSWESLGGADGPFGATQAVLMPQMALDSAGAPVVAGRTSNGSGLVTLLRRWDGQAWTRLAGGALADPIVAYASHLSLAIDAADRPVVLRGYGGYGASVERWDGAAWQALAGLSALPLAIEDALAIDATGAPVVLTRAEGLVLERFDGAAFAPSAPVKLTEGEADVRGDSMAADKDGGIFVAWEEAPAHANSWWPSAKWYGYVARWTPEGWTPVFAPIEAGSADVLDVHVALGGPFEREPVTAWVQVGPPTSQSGLFVRVPR